MVKNKISIKTIFKIIGKSFTCFMNDKGLKLSASLSYYTIFSIGPMLMVILAISGLFYEKEALQGKVFQEIDEFVGRDAALQIQDMLRNMALSGKSTTAIITGIVTLIIGATGVFIEIQDSINQIWRVKAIPKKGWLKLIKNRILSLSMVGSLGFLLIVSLVINGIIAGFSNILGGYLPPEFLFLFDAINPLITF